MKLDFCVICGSKTDLQHHHIIPKSKGGDDHPHNFLTLCWKHHNWIHDIRKTRSKEDFVACIKVVQKNGAGGRLRLPKEKELEVCKLWNDGKSYRQIQKETGVAFSTIQRISKDYNLPEKPSPPKTYKKTKKGQYKLF